MHLFRVLDRQDSLTTNRSLETPLVRAVEPPVRCTGRASSVRIIMRCKPPSTVNSRTVSWSRERTRGRKPSIGPMTMAGLDLNWNDPNVQRKNRGAAGYNTPQIFQMSYIYELPLGPGKRWANSGTASKIAGGWQTSGIFSAVSGQPFQLTASGASLNAVDQTQTPDQVGPATDAWRSWVWKSLL